MFTAKNNDEILDINPTYELDRNGHKIIATIEHGNILLKVQNYPQVGYTLNTKADKSEIENGIKELFKSLTHYTNNLETFGFKKVCKK